MDEGFLDTLVFFFVVSGIGISSLYKDFTKGVTSCLNEGGFNIY